MENKQHGQKRDEDGQFTGSSKNRGGASSSRKSHSGSSKQSDKRSETR